MNEESFLGQQNCIFDFFVCYCIFFGSSAQHNNILYRIQESMSNMRAGVYEALSNTEGVSTCDCPYSPGNTGRIS
jgi:hypothetical protein